MKSEKEKAYKFWTAEKMSFLSDAAEYIGFTKELASQCAASFSPCEHIVDIGCGLGYLSMDLLSHVNEVTAVDTNEEVLNLLGQKSEQRGLSSLHILKADVFNDLPHDIRFDGMTASFFGQIPELLDFIYDHVSGNAVLIRKNWYIHRFSARKTRLERLRFKDDCAMLDELGIPYDTELFSLEMGQPFRSLDEAGSFFKAHSREESEIEITHEELIKRLIKTEDEEFPYMMSAVREIGMIILSGNKVRENYTEDKRTEAELMMK